MQIFNCCIEPLNPSVQNEPHVCAVEGHACAQATADRLICQNPHNRTASSTQVRALKAMQGGICAYPGCTHARHLHAHHVVHWSAGGRTTLDNLVLICSKHHRLLHEGGYALAFEDGQPAFRNRHGLRLNTAMRLPSTDVDLLDMPVPLVNARYYGDDPTNTADGRAAAMEWLLNA